MPEAPTAVNVTLATGQPFIFLNGHEYQIDTQDDSQRFPRRHRMSFLAESHGQLQFNARPFADTQTFRANVIVRAVHLGKSAGRDDDKRYMNRDARKAPDEIR